MQTDQLILTTKTSSCCRRTYSSHVEHILLYVDVILPGKLLDSVQRGPRGQLHHGDHLCRARSFRSATAPHHPARCAASSCRGDRLRVPRPRAGIRTLWCAPCRLSGEETHYTVFLDDDDTYHHIILNTVLLPCCNITRLLNEPFHGDEGQVVVLYLG